MVSVAQLARLLLEFVGISLSHMFLKFITGIYFMNWLVPALLPVESTESYREYSQYWGTEVLSVLGNEYWLLRYPQYWVTLSKYLSTEVLGT